MLLPALFGGPSHVLPCSEFAVLCPPLECSTAALFMCRGMWPLVSAVHCPLFEVSDCCTTRVVLRGCEHALCSVCFLVLAMALITQRLCSWLPPQLSPSLSLSAGLAPRHTGSINLTDVYSRVGYLHLLRCCGVCICIYLIAVWF